MEERSRRRTKLAQAPATRNELDPQEFASSVGEAIRTTRQERGWTQVELAEAAGLSPNYIARLERGELGPSFFVAQQIAQALEISLETLTQPPARTIARSGRRLSV